MAKEILKAAGALFAVALLAPSAQAAITSYRFSGELFMPACSSLSPLCVADTRISGEFGISINRDTNGTPIQNPASVGEYFNYTITSTLPNGSPFEISYSDSDYSFGRSLVNVALGTPFDYLAIRFEQANGTNLIRLDIIGEWGATGVDDGLVPMPGVLFSLALPNPGTISVNLPFGDQLPPENYTFNRLQLTAVPVPAAVWLLGSALGGLGLIRRRGA